ncbi:hypothetical protein VOLCADRAFT_90628 [Volvox carteri f. nagariensis]|uniref:Cytochrome b5 heme-binding domain-containing protein n=1 Tax=Volvox carteri f. nagariensis TaxID=3068 RepID=D8TUX2_VOLCA|nr:uncharacterized protein VOLCADRAFT_90628 [Volvox carteri f. nagariensis]EFJ48787.1 hypothetical protein VOLCADRAFT_90628 [Volvox carteri f. nagariensis]|eukprot:XP_002950119.1 hypothetical protein VOLCADRAFT_90628 [Volvox carteri f. nagariensis]
MVTPRSHFPKKEARPQDLDAIRSALTDFSYVVQSPRSIRRLQTYRPDMQPYVWVLFDDETLALYNGKKNTPLYLAILGEVFDVTKGRRFYGDEKGYGGFVGRDASRAFVTGDFTPKGLIDQVEDLTPEQFKSLVEWRAFYHKQYTYKGRLVGRFYNSEGRPKRLLKRIEEEAARAKSDEELQREVEAQWPSCNVRWTESEGGTVWCDGGAYPRKVFMQLPGGNKPTTKCACFQELGWSDLRQVYPDCAPDAHSCKV